MTKHGMSGTKIYYIWIEMRQRCNNHDNKRYKLYGKRGISVCKEWDNSFSKFYEWAKENGYGEGLSIDRIDNNGDYKPNNCRWVTQKEQNNNTRRCNFITYKGKAKSLKQWSEYLGLNYNTLRSRLRIGWSPKKAFETPMYGRGFSGDYSSC